MWLDQNISIWLDQYAIKKFFSPDFSPEIYTTLPFWKYAIKKFFSQIFLPKLLKNYKNRYIIKYNKGKKEKLKWEK